MVHSQYLERIGPIESDMEFYFISLVTKLFFGLAKLQRALLLATLVGHVHLWRICLVLFSIYQFQYSYSILLHTQIHGDKKNTHSEAKQRLLFHQSQYDA